MEKFFTKNCAFCGETFFAKRKNTKYCCKKCNRNYHYELSRKPESKTAICQTCLKEFEPVWGSEYCSDECKENQFKNTIEIQTRVCTDCGTPTTDYRCEKCWQKIRGSISNLYGDLHGDAFI